MKNPLKILVRLHQQALQKKDPTADYLLLATADAKGHAHVRTVLIKSIDQQGVGFVTNAKGRKVIHFKKNPRVECCMVWPSLKLQVRISGRVQPMPQKKIDALWKIRPREAQLLYHLGLQQSQPIPSYAYLKKEVAALAKQWKDKKILPTAPSYIGFIIHPIMIEFLHHNPTRLNLREFFHKTPRGWKKNILAP